MKRLVLVDVDDLDKIRGSRALIADADMIVGMHDGKPVILKARDDQWRVTTLADFYFEELAAQVT